jgi:hypothetical protein
MIDGLHVPAIPFSEVVGRLGTIPPAQMTNDVPKLKVGTIFWLTVTVKEVVIAHWPVTGVNVYTPDAWLFIVVGFQIPETPFCDVFGNDGIGLPAHIVSEFPKSNTGIALGSTVTENVVPAAHCPGLGVNVYVSEF